MTKLESIEESPIATVRRHDEKPEIFYSIWALIVENLVEILAEMQYTVSRNRYIKGVSHGITANGYRYTTTL